MAESQAASKERRAVVALDYGTTSMAVAYAIIDSTDVKLDQIQLVDYKGSNKFPAVWPDDGRNEATFNDDHAIAPSIHNLETSSSVREGLEKILYALRGMKNLSFEPIKSAGGLISSRAWMSAEESVKEYLEEVFKHFIEQFDQSLGDLSSQLPVDLVLTTPVNWSYKAQNSLYRAVIAAGFNRDNFPSLKNVTLLSATEAASMYAARYLLNLGEGSYLRIGDTYVICDAGGNTVDLASYRITQLNPTLQVEEVAIPTGARCGSLYVDVGFKRWLLHTIGESNYKLLSPNFDGTIQAVDEKGGIRYLMKQFLRAKHVFLSSTVILDLPEPLDNLSIQGGLIVGGEIRVPGETMRSFFDPLVDSILDLIQGQFSQVENQRLRVKSLLLVGGFAESLYLLEEISRSMSLRHIKLLQPENPWTATVRGAVIYGAESINHSPFLAGTSTKSYGYTIDDVPSERTDTVLLKHPGASKRDRIFWVFKQGDLVLGNSPRREERRINISFTASSRRTGRIMIYSYDYDDNPPSTSEAAKDEIFVEATLAFDLTEYALEKFDRIPNSNVYSCTLTLILNLDYEGITAALALDGMVLSKSQ